MEGDFRVIAFEVQGITDLMFGLKAQSLKKDNETHDQFERRTWQEKVRLTEDGQCFLNPFAVTNSLVEAAIFLGRKVPGEGKKTYTDRFRKGVAPRDKVLLFNGKGKPATIEVVDPILLDVPSDGKHGGPKRVPRIFPTLHQWRASGSVMVFDGKITPEQFRDHLEAVGKFIGWGSMRVAGGGVNGRFMVVEVKEIEG